MNWIGINTVSCGLPFAILLHVDLWPLADTWCFLLFKMFSINVNRDPLIPALLNLKTSLSVGTVSKAFYWLIYTTSTRTPLCISCVHTSRHFNKFPFMNPRWGSDVKSFFDRCFTILLLINFSRILQTWGEREISL